MKQIIAIYPGSFDPVTNELARRDAAVEILPGLVVVLAPADDELAFLDRHVELVAGKAGDRQRDTQPLRIALGRGDPLDIVRRVTIRGLGDAVEHALFSVEGGQAATTRLLRHGVTGVICASDVLALGAIRAVRRAGLSVPDDVSVVGYDDSAFMNCTDPPLTTVRQPIEAMGKAAVALLVSQIENMAVYPEELLFEPELVVRGSTGRGHG